jgi:hypothetical protein
VDHEFLDSELHMDKRVVLHREGRNEAPGE